MTKEQCDAQGERITAVLREGAKIGDERRMPGHEYQHRTYDRVPTRSDKERVEVREKPERWLENILVAYVVMMSRNAAIES
jgi:hypothetical protein